MRVKIIVAAALVASMGSAFAGTTPATASFNAGATLSSSCDFTTSDVIFGHYDSNAPDHLQTTQTVSLHCTKCTTYQLFTSSPNHIDLGDYGYGGAMTSAGSSDSLYYQIFEANNDYWDDDMNVDYQAYSGVGDGTTQTISFLYRILKNQYIAPGSYSATQTMFVNF